MKHTVQLIKRLERLEKRFPGLCDALRKERLEVATREELGEIRLQLDSIVSMMTFQARYSDIPTLQPERTREGGSD